MCNKNSKGQTLLEMIVVVAVGILVVSALTFATISSLRNTQLAQNQAQATKLAQEGMEKVRSIRDRDGTVNFPNLDSSRPSQQEFKFSDLWSNHLSEDKCTATNSICYFILDSDILRFRISATQSETAGVFKRQVLLSDTLRSGSPDTAGQEKRVTVLVTWTDFSGPHESKLTTILRKL